MEHTAAQRAARMIRRWLNFPPVLQIDRRSGPGHKGFSVDDGSPCGSPFSFPASP